MEIFFLSKKDNLSQIEKSEHQRRYVNLVLASYSGVQPAGKQVDLMIELEHLALLQ